MYALVPNNRKCLIVATEVVNMSSANNLEQSVKQIQNAIQIAEERIRPELCLDLFDDFRRKKNVDVTEVNQEYIQSLFPTEAASKIIPGAIANAIEFVNDDWYVELWYEHLWKLLAEMVIYVATPTNYSRFESQGEMQNNPRNIMNEGGGAVSSDLATVQWKMDRLFQDRISPLISGMQLYLYNNRQYFPKYNCKRIDYSKTPDGVATQRKTAWITNIYKDRNIDECYPCRDKH